MPGHLGLRIEVTPFEPPDQPGDHLVGRYVDPLLLGEFYYCTVDGVDFRPPPGEHVLEHARPVRVRPLTDFDDGLDRVLFQDVDPFRVRDRPSLGDDPFHQNDQLIVVYEFAARESCQSSYGFDREADQLFRPDVWTRVADRLGGESRPVERLGDGSRERDVLPAERRNSVRGVADYAGFLDDCSLVGDARERPLGTDPIDELLVMIEPVLERQDACLGSETGGVLFERRLRLMGFHEDECQVRFANRARVRRRRDGSFDIVAVRNVALDPESSLAYLVDVRLPVVEKPNVVANGSESSPEQTAERSGPDDRDLHGTVLALHVDTTMLNTWELPVLSNGDWADFLSGHALTSTVSPSMTTLITGAWFCPRRTGRTGTKARCRDARTPVPNGLAFSSAAGTVPVGVLECDAGDAIATGHVGVEEARAVIEYGTDRSGVAVVTHPEFRAAKDGAGLSVDEQAKLVHSGVYFGRRFIATDDPIASPFLPDVPEAAYGASGSGAIFDSIITGIEATGLERNLTPTDYGQPNREFPSDALEVFHERLPEASVSRSDRERVARGRPGTLFGGA